MRIIRLTETQLNDIALNFSRTRLVTISGAAVPSSMAQREVMVSLKATRFLFDSAQGRHFRRESCIVIWSLRFANRHLKRL
jgi:hypothetical protein